MSHFLKQGALLLPRRNSLIIPKLIGTSSSQTGDPTIPTHSSKNLIVVACGAAATTIPTEETGNGWTRSFGVAHTGNNASVAVFTKYAVGSSNPINITGDSALRVAWVFENAIWDSAVNAEGTNATLNFAAHTPAAPSLVGVFMYTPTAQTSAAAAFAGILASGFTQRANRNLSSAGWAGDSGTNLLTSFDPADGTFDTSPAKWLCLSFAVRGGIPA